MTKSALITTTLWEFWRRDYAKVTRQQTTMPDPLTSSKQDFLQRRNNNLSEIRRSDCGQSESRLTSGSNHTTDTLNGEYSISQPVDKTLNYNVKTGGKSMPHKIWYKVWYIHDNNKYTNKPYLTLFFMSKLIYILSFL